MNTADTRPTALRIPSPWSGDENDPIPWSYRWWFALYWSTRIIRHWFGLHDRVVWGVDETRWRCTWCGKVSPAAGFMKIRVRIGDHPEREVGSAAPTPEAVAALLREVADRIQSEE